MNLGQAIANDCDYFDNTITITVQPIGQDPIAGVSGVVYSQLSFTQVTLAGGTLGLQDKTRNFSIPIANLGQNSLPDNSLITDNNGAVWKVLNSSLATLETRIQCACILLQGVVS